jgi:hypothetical protein
VVYTYRWWMYAIDIYRMAAVQIHYGQTHVAARTIRQQDSIEIGEHRRKRFTGLFHEHPALYAELFRDEAITWHFRNDEDVSQPERDLCITVL